MSTVLPDATGVGTQYTPPSSYSESPVFGPDVTAVVARQLEERWARDSSFLGTMCHYALVPTGKLFRPTLLAESALAVGGELEWVLPAAVGAECGHVASLVHDDIIDHDDLRRGRASVQHKFGVGDAIVAGDALIFDLFAGLAECRKTGVPAERVVASLAAVSRAGLDLCRGQCLEAELSRDLRFDRDGYLMVAKLKTAAYFRGACESGAIMGGGQASDIEALAAYGEYLGLAFQIHDDLLSYVSAPESTGKSATSDLENARMTLPVITAYLAGSDEERRVIRDCMAASGDPADAFVVLDGLLRRTGAIERTAAVARDYAQKARYALDCLPPSASRDRLCWIAELVIARDH